MSLDRSEQLGSTFLGVTFLRKKTLLTFTYSLLNPIKLVFYHQANNGGGKNHHSFSYRDSYLVLLLEGHRLPWSFFTVCEQSHISVLCVPPDLREIVFVLQSQRNPFHVRQAERLRADLLKQAHGLTEVRFKTPFTRTHFFEIYVGKDHH